jgi:nucleotide-binding universal stress UspA family protein
MYRNILIPTDGSELAGKAVQHGITFAKEIGAKITVLTVIVPFHVLSLDPQVVEDTPIEYDKQVQEHAAKLLDSVECRKDGRCGVRNRPGQARAPLQSHHRCRQLQGL